MISPDMDVMRALSNLKASESFQQVLDWVQKSLDTVRVGNDTAEGSQLYWGQGRAQELDEFLGFARDVEQHLTRRAQTVDRTAKVLASGS